MVPLTWWNWKIIIRIVHLYMIMKGGLLNMTHAMRLRFLPLNR